jgi:hypothetical protein
VWYNIKGKALSQQKDDFQRFFATRLRVILSEVPPRSHSASPRAFGAKPQKFDKLRMTPIGVRRDAVEIRPTGGSNAIHRVWNLAKNQLFHVKEPKEKIVAALQGRSLCTARTEPLQINSTVPVGQGPRMAFLSAQPEQNRHK